MTFQFTDAQTPARTQTLSYNFLDALLSEKNGAGRNDRFGYDLNHNRVRVIKDSTDTNGYHYIYR